MTRVCAPGPVLASTLRPTKSCSNSYALSLALLPQPFSVSVSPQSLFLSVTPPLSHLFSPIQPSQLYPSADVVVILDATSLRLVRTLAFSQVFPSQGHASARILSLAVDPALKLVCTSFPYQHCFFHSPCPSLPLGDCCIRSEACRLVPLWSLRPNLACSLVAPSSR
jgi:hypothetical protein